MKEILRYGYTEMPKIDAILAMYGDSVASKHNNCGEDESVVIYWFLMQFFAITFFIRREVLPAFYLFPFPFPFPFPFQFSL